MRSIYTAFFIICLLFASPSTETQTGAHNTSLARTIALIVGAAVAALGAVSGLIKACLTASRRLTTLELQAKNHETAINKLRPAGLETLRRELASRKAHHEKAFRMLKGGIDKLEGILLDVEYALRTHGLFAPEKNPAAQDEQQERSNERAIEDLTKRLAKLRQDMNDIISQMDWEPQEGLPNNGGKTGFLESRRKQQKKRKKPPKTRGES